MSTTCRLLTALLAFAFAFAGATARAERNGSKGDDCFDQMSRVDVDPRDGLSAEPTIIELIVPCAVVDSGVLGPDCAAADFYVVNGSGTLLCRVDLAVLAHAPKSSTIEDAPPAAASTTPYAAPPATSQALAFALHPPLITDVMGAAGVAGLDEGIDLVAFRPRPS